MHHPDEGTIHAWLDDALSADESRAFEHHVNSCEQCATAVAEARGLLAASTRILSALDDVPSGVLPSSTPSDVTQPLKPLRNRNIRLNRYKKAIAAAAALVIMVSGGSYVMQRSDMQRSAATTQSASEAVASQIELSNKLDEVLTDSPSIVAAATQQSAKASVSKDSSSAEAAVTSAKPSVLADSVVSVGATRVASGGMEAGRQNVAAGISSAEKSALDMPPPTAAAPAQSFAARSATATMTAATATALKTEVLTGCYASSVLHATLTSDSLTLQLLNGRVKLTDSLVTSNRIAKYVGHAIGNDNRKVRSFAWSTTSTAAVRIFPTAEDTLSVIASLDSATTDASVLLRRITCP